ncbi:MAG: Uma2 family endonuclease [Acidobacteria bacterium]|jgi:Uma2 family endonuclease|nr:Uma2 family endonuclease [Acidobacteriota bacterium]MCU0254096.1 Uma2 family endonuclease [Acidobacteriota bacterium]
MSHGPAGPRRSWTFAEYRALPDDGLRYEVLDGELVVVPSPSIRHQSVLLDLAVRLRPWLDAHGGDSLLIAPLDVRLHERTVCQPDLLVIAAADLARHPEEYVDGPPLLVCEIVSRSTRGRDLIRKRSLYARFGVPWYWIVDPDGRSIEELQLDGDAYATVTRVVAPARFASALFAGLELDLDALLPAP